MRILLIGIILLLNSYILSSQNSAEQKFKLAESYEKNGDNRNASRIYLDLHTTNPKIESYFQGVIRTLKALNQFSDLLPIIEKRLQTTKTTNLLALQGELLWKIGKTDEANKAWDQALGLSPKLPNAYVEVSQAQINLRLYEKAIVTLNQARTSLGDPLLYADQLCQLYIGIGNYEKGSVEAINLFEQTGNIALAQGRLQALMMNKEATVHIKNILTKKTQGEVSVLYLKLYSWFLRATKEFDEALEVIKKVDKKSNSQGRDVYEFAEICRHDSHFDPALKAYSYVIDQGRGNPFAVTALFGYARTLENRFETDSTLTKDFLQDIVKRYRNVIDQYPNSPTADDCQLRIAMIYKDHFQDYVSAIKELNEIIKRRPRQTIAATSEVILGEILILQERFDEAVLTFNNILKNYKNSQNFEREKSLLFLANIELLQGMADTAQKHFYDLVPCTNPEIANQAVSYITLIENNKSQIKALSSFARAEMKQKQKDVNEAIKYYEEASQTGADNPIAEESLIRISKIKFEKKLYNETRESLKKLMEKYPDSIYGDLAMMMTGDCFDHESNKLDALKIYTELLSKYPRSIYLQQTRDKIRKLRAS